MMDNKKIAKELMKIAKEVSNELSDKEMIELLKFQKRHNRKSIFKITFFLRKFTGDDKQYYDVFLRYREDGKYNVLSVREILKNGRTEVPIHKSALGNKLNEFMSDSIMYSNDKDFYNEIVVPYNKGNKKAFLKILDEWIDGDFIKALSKWMGQGYFQVTGTKIKMI